jgi:hypothetical protein
MKKQADHMASLDVLVCNELGFVWNVINRGFIHYASAKRFQKRLLN